MCVCVPVVLNCFREPRAVVRVDACAAHLHILQASRRVTRIHLYCSRAEQQTHVLHQLFNRRNFVYLATLTYIIQSSVSHRSRSIWCCGGWRRGSKRGESRGGEEKVRYRLCDNYTGSSKPANHWSRLYVFQNINDKNKWWKQHLSRLSVSKFPRMLLVHSTDAVVSFSIRHLSRGLQIQTVEGFLPRCQHHMYFGSKPPPELVLR